MDQFLYSLPAVFTLHNVLAMLISTLAGIVVGALPGLSATMGVALLIPFTFSMEPLTGLLCMAGMYNGAIYGGSISAILLNIPGTPASVCTTLDGNVMARTGRPRYALEISVISSFVGGVMSALSLMLIAPHLARFALRFGPAESFWVAVLGLSTIASFISGSVLKGLLSACIGLLISIVGVDQLTGTHRFTFDNVFLMEGFPQIVVLIGLFSIPEVVNMLQEARSGKRIGGEAIRVNRSGEDRWRIKKDFKPSLISWLRSSIYGIVIGIIPGAGANIAAFLAYNSEKKASKTPELFGKGNPEGVRASETANNAVTASAMIPMLTFGIPGNAVTAIMVGGLLIHGLHPGPNLFMKEPDIVYGLMWGMFLTNFAMLFFGYTGSPLFAKCLRVPPILLATGILILGTIGAYSINNSLFDIGTMFCFGLVGVLMKKADIPVAPAVLGIILGPIAESELRRALLLATTPWELVTRPLSAVLVVIIVMSLLYPLLKSWILKKRRQAS
ncbi:MAG: tripartite tricarboxylate transporter permease [Candidatus Accumulibacter sp.]|jgi:putative tricarboxylic transport membrane protein|nr:tripartite tricarboxylate transporter permease [Accumulibacter sp.]